jgi:hypothetical protein
VQFTVLNNYGAHQICCRTPNAPGVWKYGHDIVVQALKTEIERCGIKVDISDKLLRCHYSHAGSAKRADGVVFPDGDLTVTDAFHGLGQAHPIFTFDVTLDSIVDGTGKWKGRRDSRDRMQWLHNALENAERDKYGKHEEGYARIDLGFLAFAASSFVVLGDTLVRFLFVLARTEARLLAKQQRQQGSAAMSEEALSNVTAHNFQAGLARISLAVCRATSARLSGVFLPNRLPRPPPNATIRRQPVNSDFEAFDLPVSP